MHAKINITNIDSHKILFSVCLLLNGSFQKSLSKPEHSANATWFYA